MSVIAVARIIAGAALFCALAQVPAGAGTRPGLEFAPGAAVLDARRGGNGAALATLGDLLARYGVQPGFLLVLSTPPGPDCSAAGCGPGTLARARIDAVVAALAAMRPGGAAPPADRMRWEAFPGPPDRVRAMLAVSPDPGLAAAAASCGALLEVREPGFPPRHGSDGASAWVPILPGISMRLAAGAEMRLLAASEGARFPALLSEGPEGQRVLFEGGEAPGRTVAVAPGAAGPGTGLQAGQLRLVLVPAQTEISEGAPRMIGDALLPWPSAAGGTTRCRYELELMAAP